MLARGKRLVERDRPFAGVARDRAWPASLAPSINSTVAPGRRDARDHRVAGRLDAHDVEARHDGRRSRCRFRGRSHRGRPPAGRLDIGRRIDAATTVSGAAGAVSGPGDACIVESRPDDFDTGGGVPSGASGWTSGASAIWVSVSVPASGAARVAADSSRGGRLCGSRGASGALPLTRRRLRGPSLQASRQTYPGPVRRRGR